ncbi:MAG: hypothetical protein P4L84_29945 [Isosphaeraceae bacterium]|nr:hypothetical protein [Isosphaeraceae bacterium]
MQELLKGLTWTAHPDRTINLRLMPHPIVRYNEPKAGLTDGAMFAFASGTNLEGLVLIEPRGSAPEKASWQYAVALITAAPYEVSIDRREVCFEPYNPRSRIANEAYFTLHPPLHVQSVQ